MTDQACFKHEWCDHPNMQDVKSGLGTLLAKVCPACRERWAPLVCVVCAEGFWTPVSGRVKKYCGAACQKANAKKRARKEDVQKRQTMEKVEGKR